jgi:hypothetical protein
MTADGLGRRAGLSFGLIVAAVVALAWPGGARAADDGGGTLLDSVASFVGMQGDKDEDSIDYRARAPIVLPKDRALPAPLPPAAKQRANWPTDPNVAARRREVAERDKPAPQVGLSNSGRISKEELLNGRTGLPDKETRTTDCAATAGTPSCLYTTWDKLKAKVTGQDEKDLVVGGVEPPREYLTEPPTGYRRPVKTTALTAVKPDDTPDAGDAGAYIRKNSGHKYSVDE